jgi:uncharacterized protein YggE
MRYLLLIFLLLGSATASAEEPPYIAVNASGWVEAVPDMLTVVATVRATGRDVAALQREVDQTTGQVVAAARELGIEEGDIDSSRINIQPEYDWKASTRIYRGQSVQRTISMTLRDTGRYGDLVMALSRYDLHSMSQPRLEHSAIDELRLEAMDRALAQGRVKAERIAKGIGAELGSVIRVEEHGGPTPMPVQRMAMMEDASHSAPTIDFGKQRIAVSVAMRFAIE